MLDLVFIGLSSTGCFLGGLAAWQALLSKHSRELRVRRQAEADRNEKVQLLILGSDEVRLHGQVVRESTPGLAERMSRHEHQLADNHERLQQIQGVLANAPLLNGGGRVVLRNIAEMKEALRDHIAHADRAREAMWTALNTPKKD